MSFSEAAAMRLSPLPHFTLGPIILITCCVSLDAKSVLSLSTGVSNRTAISYTSNGCSEKEQKKKNRCTTQRQIETVVLIGIVRYSFIYSKRTQETEEKSIYINCVFHYLYRSLLLSRRGFSVKHFSMFSFYCYDTVNT